MSAEAEPVHDDQAPSRPELLELYKVAVHEEHFYIGEHQRRLAYFATLISALLGVTFIALGLDPGILHWRIAVACVPLLAAGVAVLAPFSAARSYRRFLIAVTTRAKIEAELGLLEPLDAAATKYGWAREGIVFGQHHRDRAGADGARHFVDKSRHRGQQGLAAALFGVVAVGAFALAALIAFGA